MSSIVLGNGTKNTANATSNATSGGGGGGGSSISMKRKYSQDGSGKVVVGATTLNGCTHSDTAGISNKRVKCSHPTSHNSVNGGNAGGIATNTILITNNYSGSQTLPTSTTSTSNSSQITILAQHDGGDDDDEDDKGSGPVAGRRPMVVDQINICINNHFSSDTLMTTTTTSATAKLPDLIKIQKTTTMQPKPGYEADVKEDGLLDVEQAVEGFKIKKEPLEHEEEEVPQPRVTLLIEQQTPAFELETKRFSIGEEVLVPRKSPDDLCFYLGILTVLRGDQCLVQFEDGSNCWAAVSEIKRLLRQPNTIYCVVCKTRERRQPRDDSVHDCANCGRVYHTTCLRRELSLELAKGRAGDVQQAEVTVKCLRCFKRETERDLKGVQMEQHREVDEEEEEQEEGEHNTDPVTESQRAKGKKSNSSSTGNSTTTASSVIGHNQQHVEIGAPSIDWFTKEARNSPAEDMVDMVAAEEDEEPATGKADEFYEDANGRRLRKRQQKRNYKDIQRTSIPLNTSSTPSSGNGGGVGSSWSCASSTSSNTSSSATSSSWAHGSPFTTTTTTTAAAAGASSTAPPFTLDELRWAFLPKSHKSFRRRSTKKVAADKKPVKVPYEKATEPGSGSSSSSVSSRTSSRRASRDVQAAGQEYTTNSSSSSSSSNREAAATLSTMDTKTRLSRGAKFDVRGKRQDAQGNVQYLIEWEEEGEGEEDVVVG